MKRLSSMRRGWWSIPITAVLVGVLLVMLLPVGIAMIPGGFLAISLSACDAAPDTQGLAPGDEIVGERSRTGKTRWLGGDSYALDLSMASVHFQDAVGDWQEIDSQFVPAVAPWDWEMTEAGYSVRVKEDFTAGQVIEFSKAGESVTLQPMALEWTNNLDQIQAIAMPSNVAALVTNPEVDLLPVVGVPGHTGTIRWNDAYGPGVDFEWQTGASRLAKVIEIDDLASLPVPAQYIVDGGSPVLRFNMIFAPSAGVDIYVDGAIWDQRAKALTFSTIEFRKGSEVLWGFMPLLYWGSGTDWGGQSVATLDKRGNSLYISIRVPYDWLQEAVFPVFIDVVVDEQTAAQNQDGYEQESDGAMNIVNTVTLHNSNTAASGRFWGGFYWASGDFPLAGDTVDVAYIEVYVHHGNFDDANFNMHFQDGTAAPAVFTTNASDITNRTRTAASVSWIQDGVLPGWEQSDSLVAPAQEVIDNYSPSVMVLVTRPNQDANKVFYSRSYDYSGNVSGAKLHMEWTAAAACVEDIANAGGNWAIGTVSTSSVFWSSGSEPTWPLVDGDALWTITNSSGGAVDINIKGTNFTGGVGWTLAGAIGENIVILTAFEEGDGSGDGLVLTTGDQQLMNSLADSANKDWELKFNSASSHTDGVGKSSTVTVTAVCE